MNGTLIASTPRGTMHPLAYQGILATDCHHQIVSILRSRLGDAHVLLFAEPAFDPGRDSIDWYTPVQGTPVRMVDLPESRQDQIRVSLLKMAADIQTQTRQLKDTGDNNRILSGSIIDLALQYPGEECIYLVGEQPVIICWGFGPANSGAMPQDLSRLAPLTRAAATRPEKPLAEPAPPEPKGVPGPHVAPGPAAIPGPVAIDTGRRRGLPWWLRLLLLLLLLLLALWFFREKLPRGWLAFLSPEQAAMAPSAAPGDLDAVVARGRELRQERDALRAALVEKAGQCREPGTTPGPDPSRANELQVPPDAGQGGDLGFLQGVWRCDSDLSTPKDPVIVDYMFDAAGKGQITVKTATKICSAGVKAILEPSGDLRIESDETIPCSTGSPIDGQRVECVGRGAQTNCQGVNITTKGTWRAKFFKF